MSNTTNSHIPTVVYVEDNTGDALLLQEALRESGHAVQLMVIPDGSQALHYFQIKASARDLPPPHCILLDAHLPLVTGAQLLRFIRTTAVYADTPVYIFAPETEYRDLLQADLVSKESFLTKSESWDGFLELAHLLMKSATAKKENLPASPTDSNPEVHAEGALRRQDTKEQREKAAQLTAADPSKKI